MYQEQEPLAQIRRNGQEHQFPYRCYLIILSIPIIISYPFFIITFYSPICLIFSSLAIYNLLLLFVEREYVNVGIQQLKILCINILQQMNLEYPLNESYYAYSHIQIIKLKEKNKTIIIGFNSSENQYSALVIKRLRAHQPLADLAELLTEFGPFSSQQLLKEELKKQIGDYQSKDILFGEGILGFHRFLQGYYLHYIVQKDSIAKIGRHKINEVLKTNIISLFELRPEHKNSQNKYRQILDEYKVENFYYSCSYDMTYPLSKNMVEIAKPFYENATQNIKGSPSLTDTFFSDSPNLFGICEIFHFNYKILEEFAKCVKNKKWVLSVVHGYCKQINVNFKGTVFNVIIIARRCRHHAGTRYIKRGINSDGFVANYVQVQQIVVNYSLSQDTRPVCSSFIQMRGSVPTYWMQRPSIAIPKPNIEIRANDYLYSATRKHFHDLIGRYGQTIYAVNLMKVKQKTVRQSGLSKEYRQAIQFINKNDLEQWNSIHYVEIDMKYNLKLDKNMFVNKVRALAFYSLQKTGFFLCYGIDRNTNDQYVEFQNGLIRANCVDCLDRTNSFQQLVGQTVLSVQLSRLLKQQTKFQNLQLDGKIMQLYSELYERMGDLISIQYGSSYAHKQKIQKTTESRNEFWTSIKRHFNNNLKDYDRQQQIDVFLGYRADKDGPQLWDVKPPIEHFPSKRVKAFEQKQNYFKDCYQYFKNEYNFQLLELSNNRAKSQVSWLNKLQDFGKQDLKKKFTADIVNALINQKQQNEKFRFCLTPKLILQKRAWKEMNPQPKLVETLQQKLSYPYNKMQFLKDEIKSQTFLQLNSKKYLEEEQKPKLEQMPKKLNKLQTNNIQFLAQYDEEIKEIMNNFITQGDHLDADDLETIQNYMKGEIVKDEEIQEEIRKCQEGLLGELDVGDDVYARIRMMAQEEIKMIQVNYSNGNYIGLQKKKKQTGSTLQNKKASEQKNGKIKDNKVMMLQQIMQHNFTHGQIKGQVTEL